MEKKMHATEEQVSYARVLDIGMKTGLLALIILFILYLSGIFAPFIPVNDLPQYWGKSVHAYLETTHIEPGWSWLKLLHKGDFLTFLGIAFLAGITIICYAAIIPIFFRKRDRVYGVIAVIECLVLALAASGILRSGGH